MCRDVKMLDVCFYILGVAGVLLLFYFLLEVHYFFRSLLCVMIARFIKKKKHIMDETTITGICLSNDVDYLLDHMNNARYIRELDFAKVDFYERTQLYKRIVSKGGSLYIGATTIRYRRFIKVFSIYHISTKVIYWDNQNIYVEHKFISDNFIRAIALSRLRLLNIDVEELMEDLIHNSPKNIANVEYSMKKKPEMPEELEKWIESNQISSNKLREKNEAETIIIERV